jgi:hypothetical protein
MGSALLRSNYAKQSASYPFGVDLVLALASASIRFVSSTRIRLEKRAVIRQSSELPQIQVAEAHMYLAKNRKQQVVVMLAEPPQPRPQP